VGLARAAIARHRDTIVGVKARMEKTSRWARARNRYAIVC
jgi:predicted amidohydrolase